MVQMLGLVSSGPDSDFPRSIVFASRQDRPDNPGILVGQCDRYDIWMPALTHLPDPLTSRILFASRRAEHRAGAVDHQCTKVSITPFTDAEQPGFAAT